MPLDMPESVLVRFKGKMQPGVTLRDLVNAIPLYAIKSGLLTVAKQGKKNIFSGRILEIEGLPDLKVEQAFELSDASAERSAAGCTVHLNKEPIIEYINSNITLMRWMIAEGYADGRTLARRIAAQEAWLKDPQLLKGDADADYAAVIEIDLADIHEPIVACPNDPDDVKTLSEVAGAKIDFIDHEAKESVDTYEELLRVAASLEDVNLDAGLVMNKLPAELSGGMRKRVGLARAIVGEPQILLYDEPVTGLDPVNAVAVDRLITDIAERTHVTSIVVTHDVEGALSISDRVALLEGGHLRFLGTPDEFRRSDDTLVRAFADRQAAVEAALAGSARSSRIADAKAPALP